MAVLSVERAAPFAGGFAHVSAMLGGWAWLIGMPNLQVFSFCKGRVYRNQCDPLSDANMICSAAMQAKPWCLWVLQHIWIFNVHSTASWFVAKQTKWVNTFMLNWTYVQTMRHHLMLCNYLLFFFPTEEILGRSCQGSIHKVVEFLLQKPVSMLQCDGKQQLARVRFGSG